MADGDLTPEEYEMLFGEPPPASIWQSTPPPPPPVSFSVAPPPPPSSIQDAPPPPPSLATPSPLATSKATAASRFAGMSLRRKAAMIAVGGIAVISVVNSAADDSGDVDTIITDDGTEQISNFSEPVEDVEAEIVTPIEDKTTTTAAPTTTTTSTTTTTAAPTTTTTASTTTTTAAPTTVAPAAVAPIRDCQGYNPCIEPGPDVDCAGGSGNGPRYSGPVSVTGSDPYDLDRDGDGRGCE